MGPARRRPEVNELGMQVQVITIVKELGQDRRLIEPNLVESSEETGRCVALLTRPGTYQVTLEITTSQWIWVVSEEASSVSVRRLRQQDLPEKFDRRQFIIRVTGDCPEEEEAKVDVSDSGQIDPMTEKLRAALLRVLSDHGPELDDSSVKVESWGAEGLWRFAIRISDEGCILPTLDSIANCSSSKAQVSASRLLIGSLQVAGGASRVTARIIDVETGEILTASKGDSTGTDTDALVQAASDAIGGLGVTVGCKD